MGKDYTRMFTALSGSQNYGLDTENSDVDTKSIFIPNFSTLLFTKKLLSETWILDNNEHIEAKDVREMGIQLLKQGLNFVEILFTPYVDINPKYTGTESPHEVSQHLSGIIFIDDHSIFTDTYSCHIYLNPNAVNPITLGDSYLHEIVRVADSRSVIDDFIGDNY